MNQNSVPKVTTETPAALQHFQAFFPQPGQPPADYDVIVIGSGAGGAILACALAERGLKTLILEAGGVSSLTNFANLPFPNFNNDALFHKLKVPNLVTDSKDYVGGQVLAFGGKMNLWGALTPRMTRTEFAPWPAGVGEALHEHYYAQAETLLNATTQPSAYSALVKQMVERQFKLRLEEASYAFGPHAPALWGRFSVTDLFLDSLMRGSAGGQPLPHVLLFQPVLRLHTQNSRVVGVETLDIASGTARQYRAPTVVLCAGALGSPLIVQRSDVALNRYVGTGITDHAVRVVRFAIPAGSSFYPGRHTAAKLICQLTNPLLDDWPFNLQLQINTGLRGNSQVIGDSGQVEGVVVFMFSSPLIDSHTVQHEGGADSPFSPVRVAIEACPIPAQIEQECLLLAKRIIAQLGGRARPGETLDLITAPVGNVAHEVGSLRMGPSPDQGVVDSDCRLFACENLYTCDLSVFPTSPAANPTLTLAALALRLADHLAFG